MEIETPCRPTKDPHGAHPIPLCWRPMIRSIVQKLANGDFVFDGLSFVSSVDCRTQQQMKAYLASYGETIVELPEATWNSSIAQWMDTYWEVLVDLWTKESGVSDLCLSLRVFEDADGSYRIEVDSLHVP